jgi:hypothetical protein
MADPNCPCDAFTHPLPPAIPAGLATVPHQRAGFPEFRRALLRAAAEQPALDAWRARDGDDLGLMLLEMAAYVCDNLAFYDALIAQEAYVRTARRRPSLRRLVGLLGYVPRPAVAAAVDLAILADGRQPVALPAGLAFRSGAFGDEPPQVFELDDARTVHPLQNRWALGRPRQAVGSGRVLLLTAGTARLKRDDVTLVREAGNATATTVRTVTAVAPWQDAARGRYVRVEFDQPLGLAAEATAVTVATPSQSAALWTMAKLGTDPTAIETSGSVTRLTLDGLYRQIKPGAVVILSRGASHRWFAVTQATEKLMTLVAAGTITLKDSAGKDVPVGIPAVQIPVTQLLLDAQIDAAGRKGAGDASWTSSLAAEIVVRYALVDGGTVTTQPKAAVEPGEALALGAAFEVPPGGFTASAFLLEDANGDGARLGGSLDADTGVLTLDGDSDLEAPLVAPVELFGNVVRATRGETVAHEVLGAGDASQPTQSFTLEKKPLTYVPSPTSGNERGVASTLRVWVDGVRWTEAPSFYGHGRDAEVYVVRENDQGEAVVTFDRRRAAPLPTGAAVVASYRHGAGAASPPAGSLVQLAAPVAGVASVRNPVAAAGGADAEGAATLRRAAPASALLLGRAVSIQDMEAVAAGAPGVRATRVEWRWHGRRQGPVVQVWYVGEAGIELALAQTLRRLSNDTTAIDVDPAVGRPVHLALDLEVDPRRLKDDVLREARAALLGDEGLLAPERIGIGLPLYRSRIFAAVMAVEGVHGVRAILWDGKPFADFARSPGAGRYFDLEAGALLLNGQDGTEAKGG